MSILKKFDTLGYIYTFEYYLYEKEIDYTVTEFMHNNNTNFFYVCFFDIIRDNTHYLITTNPADNLHELIMITNFNTSSENRIITENNKTIIYYNNFAVSISNKMELHKINNLINITPEEIQNYDLNYYDHWPLGAKSWTLNLKTKLVDHTSYKYHLHKVGSTNCLRILSLVDMQHVTVYTEINIRKFDMDKLFPCIKTITESESNKVLYKK